MNDPPDLIRFDRPGLRLSVVPAFEAGALAHALAAKGGFERMLSSARRVPGGRGSHWLIEPGPWSKPVRIRPLDRGGWLGPVLRDRFATAGRPHAELARWQALRSRGAPVPDPVFALSRRTGPTWRCHLAAIERPDALDGLALIESDATPERLLAAARALARSLRRFHDAGAIHGDLQLRNVLFEARAGGTHCWLIDLDRSRLTRSVSPRRRMRELMRLYRSLEKTGHAEIARPRLLASFLADYCRGDRTLRRTLLERRGAETRRLARHRLGWRLKRLVTATAALALVGGSVACSDSARVAPPGEPDEPPRLSLLAVGDTGRTRSLPWLFEGQLAVAQGMAREARRAPVDGLVLLGDNFYWHGLEREHLVERIGENLVRPYCGFLRLDGPRSHEVADRCALDEERRRPVPIYAVLGNHDIERRESVELQRRVVPDFLPGWRMASSLAEVVELGQGVSLILFESELEIDDREAIRRALLEAITRAKGPWRILATHRPIATDDYGRPRLGGYPSFVHDAIAESGRPVQLVLAGHHHSLQVFEMTQPNPLLHVGAGSGSRAMPPLAQDHPDARFGAIEPGFARVDLVGRDARERLAVTLYATARWPWLATWRAPALRARFDVDRAGRVSSPAAMIEPVAETSAASTAERLP